MNSSQFFFESNFMSTFSPITRDGKQTNQVPQDLADRPSYRCISLRTRQTTGFNDEPTAGINFRTLPPAS
ncbi:hypothetical protein CITRIK5_60006 [Citricoccus sp. K5]|nr:hypothetical protein CITRIK5_60006 [Citricoccus sp. K5]